MLGVLSGRPVHPAALICAVVLFGRCEGGALPAQDDLLLPADPGSRAAIVEKSQHSDSDLPFFPIPTIDNFGTQSEPENGRIPASPTAMRDSRSQQTDAKLSHQSDTPASPSIADQPQCFRNLEYTMLGCQDFFQSPDETPFIVPCSDVLELLAAADGDQSPHETSTEATGDQPDSTPIHNSGLSTAPRPMTSINLATAVSATSDSGELLQTPDGASDIAARPRTQEHHFVPAPWHRSHSSRNTFKVRYQPLYFEDPNLERCGDSAGCLTEFVSIAHFAGRIPLLPYMMASQSPHECVRSLPDCPTCSQFGPEAYLAKPTVKAIAVQAAATTGFIYIIP